MTIIDKELRDNCDPSSNNYTELRSSSQFHIAHTHIDITLWGQCNPECVDLPDQTASLKSNPDWHYNLTAAVSVPEACRAQAVLPVNNSGGPVNDHQIIYGGFPIRWNASKSCRDCQSSGGHCGYYDSSMQFHCRCRRHSLYPGRCPAVHSGWFNTPNKTAIAIMTGIIGSAPLIIALLLVIAYRKKMFFFNHEVPGRKRDNLRSISKVKTFLNSYVDEMQTRYSYSSLKKITNNFAQKLGEGGFGVVYKGKLPSGTLVAFKMLDHSRQSETQFMTEVATIGRIHHFYLVRLLGKRKRSSSELESYVAPEVWSRNLGPVTDKSDVYSFDMMLLEMVGGRKNIEVQVSRSSQFYFPEWAFKLIENGELRTRLREREISGADEAKARSLAKVGLWCIQYNSTDRSSMMRVLQMLEGDADDIPNPPTPFSTRPPSAPFSASEESSTIEIETA
ncbi:hypothetical protein SUGI_0116510 [Cryptomeria japonica]|nr:hypothetical protein SUGI_0116510 [Cryptomeria japonica]